jgi:Uma2 family endonuclease
LAPAQKTKENFVKSHAKLRAMNAPARKPMTLAEFLEWESRQELRHEFDGFQPVAMTGGTRAHAGIQANLAIAIGGRLSGKPCKFYGSDLKIEVDGKIRYPDGFVTCSAGDNKSSVVKDPVVIFEVLSPSTASKDRIVKSREYQATPSVQRYVMLEQDRVGATVYARLDGEWNVHVLLDDANLAMPQIGTDVPLAEFYEGLVFGAQDNSDELPQSE